MKSMCAALALALVSTFSVGVSTTAAAQEYKIGVVDMQQVLQKYTKRQQKYDALEKEVAAKQVEIDALSKKIETAKTDYNTKKAAGAESSTLIGLETQIRKDYADYESKLKEHQATIDGMEKQVLQEVIGDVETAITNFGTSGNYHLILNAREGAGGGAVVYHATALDVTAAILQQLNGGAAAAPAAAPAEGGEKKKKKD